MDGIRNLLGHRGNVTVEGVANKAKDVERELAFPAFHSYQIALIYPALRSELLLA